jgi:Flp pilus assembly pilin Flp
MFKKFRRDESGAVTVDWVVMTAATVGLGIAAMGAVSTGVENLSSDASSQLADQSISTSFGTDGATTYWSGDSASDYLAYGQSQAPGNNGAAYFWAQQAAAEDAPEGYNFDDPLVDTVSGNVVYTSNDGQTYSVGGQVYPVDAFDGNLQGFTA